MCDGLIISSKTSYNKQDTLDFIVTFFAYKSEYEHGAVTVDHPARAPPPPYIKLCAVLPLVARIDYDVRPISQYSRAELMHFLVIVCIFMSLNSCTHSTCTLAHSVSQGQTVLSFCCSVNISYVNLSFFLTESLSHLIRWAAEAPCALIAAGRRLEGNGGPAGTAPRHTGPGPGGGQGHFWL